MIKAFWGTAVLAALFGLQPAMAQDAPTTPGDEGSAGEPGSAGEAGAAEGDGEQVTDASATKSEKDMERDLALFWGRRRQVKVVQKRLYEKDGRLELTVFGANVPNDDFINYWPIGLRAGYHISEAWAVEGSFAYAFESATDLQTFLKDEIGLRRADIQEIIQFYYGVDILWAPLFGKISVLGAKLTHFETYIGLGVGMVHTETFDPDKPRSEPDKAPKPAGNTILGFRWFLTDTFDLRTEYRQFFFQKYKGGLSIPAELSLGLGFMI